MARTYGSSPDTFAIAGLGRWIGEALGEGILAGAQGALAELGQELAPVVEDILAHLREGLETALAESSDVAEVSAPTGTRTCEEPGCQEPSLARNLCRKHYARRLYQERKARQGTGSPPAPRRRPRMEMGEHAVMEKKLAAVAPIIRRKKSDEPAAIEAPQIVFTPPSEPTNVTPLPLPQPPPPPPPAAPAGISVESVARFFGINKG
jgi:hypothetical protein